MDESSLSSSSGRNLSLPGSWKWGPRFGHGVNVCVLGRPDAPEVRMRHESSRLSIRVYQSHQALRGVEDGEPLPRRAP